MTIIPQFEAVIIRRLIDGLPVNGHLNRSSELCQVLAEAIQAAPPSGELRARAFEAALIDLPDSNEIRAAVFAVDPNTDIEQLVPGPKSFADIGQMLGPICWDWEYWLATGFVTILASESGTGKSALSLALCDCYLRRKPWPDGKRYSGERGAVLWCEAEAAQAINLERARSWGMPLEKIYTLLDNPLEDLNLDSPAHKTALYDFASRPDVRLIVIDSLSGADSKAEKGVEESMTIKFLAELARDSHKPVIVTHHLRKRSLFDGDSISLDRLRGSSAIVQMARLVWALDTPDPHNKDWKRLAVVKSNLAKFPVPVGVSITENGVRFGAAPEEPKTEGVLDRATDLLLALLQSGARPAKEIEAEFDQAGISVATMKRAKDKLGIVSRKDKDGWSWALPVRGQYDN